MQSLRIGLAMLVVVAGLARVIGASTARAESGHEQTLSDERTFTRWAHPAHLAPIFARPTSSSRRVSRLHWYTELGYAEVYLLLKARWDSQGREWVKLRVPMRPNGREGWVQRPDLGRFHLTHELLVVDGTRLRASLYSRGRRVWSAPVGVGQRSTPTPAGHFWIRAGFSIRNHGSGYYPYVFSTSDYSTLPNWPYGGVVGIHGPYYDPQGIPGHISHGCVRLRVQDDRWLSHHLAVGAPVHVI